MALRPLQALHCLQRQALPAYREHTASVYIPETEELVIKKSVRKCNVELHLPIHRLFPTCGGKKYIILYIWKKDEKQREGGRKGGGKEGGRGGREGERKEEWKQGKEGGREESRKGGRRK